MVFVRGFCLAAQSVAGNALHLFEEFPSRGLEGPGRRRHTSVWSRWGHVATVRSGRQASPMPWISRPFRPRPIRTFLVGDEHVFVGKLLEQRGGLAEVGGQDVERVPG